MKKSFLVVLLLILFSIPIFADSSNEWIVFDHWENGQATIWKVKPDGSELTQLTDGYRDTSPMVSHNGKYIIFRRIEASNSNGDLYIMDINGDNLKRLTNFIYENKSVGGWNSWSLDDKTIFLEACSQGDETTCEIYSIDKDGVSLKQLTDNSYRDRSPFVNPKTGKIIFISETSQEKCV